MAEPVNRFAVEVASDDKPIINRFSDKEIDYSKLGEFDAKEATEGQKWKLALGYLTTANETARGDIIRKVLPGARISKDPSNGRVIVSYGGETGYINKPGVTLGGFFDSIAQVAKYIPAGKVASLGGNLATRAALAGGAAAATSIAEDVAAIPQGSQQGVSPEKALFTGGAALVAQPVSELVIAPAIGWLSNKGTTAWRAIRGTPNAVQGGKLTDIGRKLAERAGLNPDDVTPELASQLESAARKATAAAVPDEQLPTAVERQALSQRFKVPLTKGELTDDYAQQSLEENLKRMDVTTKAGQIMRSAEQDAATKLRGDAGESGFGLLRREINPKPVADISDAGQAIVTPTRGQAETAKGAYQAAYKTARESGAAIDARNLKDFLKNTETALKESIDYDAALFPKTAQQLDRLRGMESWFQGMGREAPRKIPLTKIENTRKLLNAAWKSADATDRLGLSILRNNFDEMVDGAIDSGRIIGDPKAVAALKAGRQLFGRYQELYAPNKEAGLAEQAAGRAVKNWLKSDAVTGEDVIRQAIQNKALTQRIIEINGMESEAHTALKQGALEYVFRPALRNEKISPRLISSQYDRWFAGQGKEQMNAIFSEKDRTAIREFVMLARAKIPQEGVINTSNSGNVVVKAMQQLGQKLGIIGAATGHVETAAALGAVNFVTRAVKSGQATSAVRGLVPVARSTVPVTAVAAGATAEKNQ